MNYMEQADKVMIKTYNRFPVVLDRGEGVYLYDVNGKKYLDFAAGIAVFSLGYNNKKYNDALKAQIDKLLHTSNLFYNDFKTHNDVFCSKNRSKKWFWRKHSLTREYHKNSYKE